MACHVDDGALASCQYGNKPTPIHASGHVPIATVSDIAPFVNIRPFGLCRCPNNPAFALLHVPVPCVPIISKQWKVANLHRVWVRGVRALDAKSSVQCVWNGRIQINNPRKP